MKYSTVVSQSVAPARVDTGGNHNLYQLAPFQVVQRLVITAFIVWGDFVRVQYLDKPLI
jgi:hypothetical protein